VSSFPDFPSKTGNAADWMQVKPPFPWPPVHSATAPAPAEAPPLPESPALTAAVGPVAALTASSPSTPTANHLPLSSPRPVCHDTNNGGGKYNQTVTKKPENET